MSKIVRLEDYRPKAIAGNYAIIEKLVNGKIVECVDVDALTPAQRSKFFSQQNGHGAP